MPDLQDLYRAIILDHARDPQNRGLVGDLHEDHTGQSHQVNPTCGDEITLRVRLTDDEAAIAALSWEGQGCSISQASASVMAELVEGRSLDEVSRLAGQFRGLMDSRGRDPEPDVVEALGDGAAFAGVSKFPARIKCALLGWAALREAMLLAAPTTGEDSDD
ncbi:Fe-S cluster assembly sulfur transfer protein SufU [Rarobacter faecitabidus]|uniref:Nitrogen fixation NifU-like protein n=1 Tax=Rarobacter faecitabidus TaxID=13243 RepID=A0A542ZVD3_RARFA|nr:SUF system NifU family Fe-S cluster assembly protein [Rarobacter faecitabidus]TQL64302.1 nitrogen fixation NifU-like protein [Rarobacter faecitabidus]